MGSIQTGYTVYLYKYETSGNKDVLFYKFDKLYNFVDYN